MSSNGFAFISSDDRAWSGTSLFSDPLANLAQPGVRPGAFLVLDLRKDAEAPLVLPLLPGPATLAAAAAGAGASAALAAAAALEALAMTDVHPHGIGLLEV